MTVSPTQGALLQQNILQTELILVRVGTGIETEIIYAQKMQLDKILSFRKKSDEEQVIIEKKNIYEFPTIDLEAFKEIHEKIDKLDAITIDFDNVYGLAHAAEIFNIQPLVERCRNFLKRPRVIFNDEPNSTEYDLSPALIPISYILHELNFPILLNGLNVNVLAALNDFRKNPDKACDKLALLEIPLMLQAAITMRIEIIEQHCVNLILSQIASFEKAWKLFKDKGIEDPTEKYFEFFCLLMYCNNKKIEQLSKQYLVEIIANNLQVAAKLSTFLDKYPVNIHIIHFNISEPKALEYVNTVLKTQIYTREINLRLDCSCNLEEPEQLKLLEKSLKTVASEVKTFSLDYPHKLDSLGFLLQCSNMEKLILKTKNITNAVWPFLQHFQELKTIVFDQEHQVDFRKNLSAKKAVKHLLNCAKLKEILVEGRYIEPEWTEEKLAVYFKG